MKNGIKTLGLICGLNAIPKSTPSHQIHFVHKIESLIVKKCHRMLCRIGKSSGHLSAPRKTLQRFYFGSVSSVLLYDLGCPCG